MKKSFFAITFGLTAFVAVGASLLTNKGKSLWFGASATTTTYQVTLDDSNAYQDGNKTQVASSLTGGEVAFAYSDCFAYDGYHAVMYSDGYITNTNPISSITKVNATFEGPLEIAYSFNGEDWSEFAIARSGKDFYFQYEPAYVMFYANQHMVALSSLTITYACEPSTDSLEFVGKTMTFNKNYFPTSNQYILSGENEFEFACHGVISNTNGIYFSSTSVAIESYTPVNLTSVTITAPSRTTFAGTIYSGTSFQAKTHSTAISNSGSKTYKIPTGDTYFMIVAGKSRTYFTSFAVNYDVPAVDPIAIDCLPDDYEVTPGMSRQMFIDYYPATTNRNKDVTWESSDTSIATVSSSGLVTVAATAPAGASVEITARSTFNSRLVSTATLNVVPTKVDEWTIMVYMCGADLESGGYQASLDIIEMCEVMGIPIDVNIFILTGGASEWGINGIPADQNLILTLGEDDETGETGIFLAYNGFESYMPMDDPNTLLTFMNMCIRSAPAKRYGLILWDHGGAMQGCCFDENVSDSSGLLNSDVMAVMNYIYEHDILTEKMDFIGYDCCLMAVQDIVVTNSLYFDYMVASEESEAGTGWDYDTWLDDLYMNKPTREVCRAICDGFIKDNDGDAIGGNPDNNQTLSYFDLSYAANYYVAFEDFAEAWMAKLQTAGTTKTTIQSFFKTVQTYAVDSSNSQLYYGVFDVYDFFVKLYKNTTLCPDVSYILDCLDAFDMLVEYCGWGIGSGNSYGMTLFYAVSANTQQTTYYDEYETPFSNWIQFNRTYGY
ncbi:MAG: clostripain-related cysteine peptidase [Bacilli bacterium]|nr:clostripain-related cysteine peptidase [Bacilli bacterium]